MSDYINTKEMAKMYGVDEETIRRWCKAGKVEAKRIGRTWYIKKDSENRDESDK